MIKQFAQFQIRHAHILLPLLLILVGVLITIASDLQINPDFGALVAQDSEFNTNDRMLSNAFVRNDALLIFIKRDDSTLLKETITDMSDERIALYVDELNLVLSQSSYVLSVSPLQISDDKRNAKLVVSLVVPNGVNSFEPVLKEINGLVNEAGSPPGIKTTVTGLPVLLQKVSTLLIQDNLNTIAITLVFIVAILLWYSRSIWFTIVTIAIPLISLIILASIMVKLGITVTITLAAVGVLILGLGVDYSIHISTHYIKAREEHEGHKQALIHTLEQLWLPITASFLTTLAGFTALMFGVSPSSQAQGLVLSLGITVIYFTTITFFPLFICMFHKRIHVIKNPFFEKILQGLSKLAIIQTRHSKTVLVLLGVITLIMFYGASKVSFSTSNSNWIPDDDPVSVSFREDIYAFSNVDVITVLVKSTASDLRNVQTQRDILNLAESIRGIPNVDSVITPYDGIEKSNDALHDALTYTELRDQFNHDYTLTTFSIVSQNLAQDDAGDSRVLAELREMIKRYPVYNAELSLFGDVVRFDELGDSLQKDAGVTTLLGLSLVFFVASVTYASLRVGILALIPIIIGVIWSVGLMGFFSVPFTSLSTGIISLVLGVGVDFSIHLIDGIKRYMKSVSIEMAINKTLTTSGKAIFLSTMTTFFGFLALTFANLLGTQRLGWSLAFSIVSVFVVSIMLIPAVMNLGYTRTTHKVKEAKK